MYSLNVSLGQPRWRQRSKCHSWHSPQQSRSWRDYETSSLQRGDCSQSISQLTWLTALRNRHFLSNAYNGERDPFIAWNWTNLCMYMEIDKKVFPVGHTVFYSFAFGDFGCACHTHVCYWSGGSWVLCSYSAERWMNWKWLEQNSHKMLCSIDASNFIVVATLIFLFSHGKLIYIIFTFLFPTALVLCQFVYATKQDWKLNKNALIFEDLSSRPERELLSIRKWPLSILETSLNQWNKVHHRRI